MNDGINSKDARKCGSLGPAMLGLSLGVAFSVSYLELVIPAIPLTMIVGLSFCLPKHRRYRLRGYLPALGIALGVMVLAVALPVKTFDRTIPPLPANKVSLGELTRAGLVYDPGEPTWLGMQVTLPSATPTRMQIVECISQQTSLDARISRCANGSTLLWGAWFSKIHLRPKKTDVAETRTSP